MVIEGRYGLSDGKVVLAQKGLKQAVYDYGRANGMSGEEIEALTRQKVSNAHTSRAGSRPSPRLTCVKKVESAFVILTEAKPAVCLPRSLKTGCATW